MGEPDYDEAVAVTREIHWVGFYDAEASLHCNPYLLIDDEDVVLIDPGSMPHFPVVMRKVIDLVNPSRITLVVASHQDPDVCGNLAVVEDVIARQDLRVAAHSRSVRLIRHYGISSSLVAVDEHDYRLVLGSGRVLEFIWVPYLHAPGAIMTYDPKTGSLFSGDLFGGMSDNWSLFAKEGYLAPLAAFHEAYMPSHAVLSACMDRVAKMRIERILPQHGSVLEGDSVKLAIDHLRELPCGSDLEPS